MNANGGLLMRIKTHISVTLEYLPTKYELDKKGEMMNFKWRHTTDPNVTR